MRQRELGNYYIWRKIVGKMHIRSIHQILVNYVAEKLGSNIIFHEKVGRQYCCRKSVLH